MMAQVPQSYFQHLPFAPAEIRCLSLDEILAEKLRSCYQRNKARDIYDLGMFAARPHNQAKIRRLLIVKLWQAHDAFDPAKLNRKFVGGNDFDWDDLRQLTRRTTEIDKERITRDCVRGFSFLNELSPEEKILAADPYQRERNLCEQLVASLPTL
ncbi:MAG: hypothetical protein JWQ49_1086 [Edaphobacter sp.]|nr:hypothetical protein [Edaphobacter sp.]